MNTNEYFKDLEMKTRAVYSVAEEARKKGLDPVSKVEPPLAMSLAEKCLGLVSTLYPQLNDRRIINRILELEKEYGQLDVAVSFKIAEEIAKEKFCKFKNLLEGIEAGIRVGFAYNTLGVVSSPIEGFTGLKLGKTKDGKDYFIANFSGPIRSAGTTASCVVLMLIDYLREMFGFAKYDPTEKEIKRYVIENYDYHERVTNLQYLPTEEEIIFLAKNLPIQIAGEPTEKLEVSNYKDLERVDTNFIRGGMCLIFSEGLAQKAKKGFRLLKSLKEKGFKTSGWDFLEEYIKLHEKREVGKEDSSPVYIKDLVAGRPVYGHPSKSGGFRFRYGRSRTNGFSAASIHPATMGISNGYLSIGTQLKIEKPTKGCVVTSCDSIDGPIVKLKNGSVKKLNNFQDAKKLYHEIEEIIYLGDILLSLGDVINRNYDLLKQGYVEEWWELELQEKAGEKENIDKFDVDIYKAIELSEKYKIPLHPAHIFYWTQISFEQFYAFLDWLGHAHLANKIILPWNETEKERFRKGKRALELLGVEHDVTTENVVLSENLSKSLLTNLGIPLKILEKKFLSEEINNISNKIKDYKDVLEAINKISKYEIKDKSGTFIGTRMGRPEKAKMRKLTGSPNVLFPVGYEGGRLRSVNEAVNIGSVKADFPIYYCKKCERETIYFRCEVCGEECKKMYYCPECKQKFFSEKCPEHVKGQSYVNKRIDIKHYFDLAIKKLDLLPTEVPKLVKGVRGTSSEGHNFEHLGKGLLRAIFGLNVNKDGTIRYDATELPLTHFKPKEIRTSIERLKELGYTKDMYGKELENEEQILELKPHDIILPSCPETKDEKADDVFLNIAHFIDMLLLKFYGLKPFYNLRDKEDLVGHLVVCMAPHNCAGVIGRIIGFSKAQGVFASPYMHAAMRRDCDGDEMAVMLLLDVLLNFSTKFLPSHRGGTQDAPLVLNVRIKAGEVDDQILDFELGEYGLELYRAAEQGKHSSEINLETVKIRLKEGKDPFVNIYFTHNSSDINLGVINSAYKTIPNMQEKVRGQMLLAEKIRAVDTKDVARLIIDRHFMRDIRGNLRKFSQQAFRCSKCNEKYRRPPLVGKCLNCGGNIIFTVSEGFIIKYLEPAIELAEKYEIPSYIKQSLELTKSYVESIFGKEKEKQEGLGKWF